MREDMRHLRLLGPARVDRAGPNRGIEKSDGGSIPRFRSQRAVALLGYLACERRTIAREYLAALLWPDQAPGKGRSKLRRELYNLVKILPGCWETDAQTVRFLPAGHTSVDIYVLRRMETERRWPEAADLLGGEFLEGLYLSDNSRFETWLLAERGRWRGRSRVVLACARDQLTRHGRYAEALLYGQRLLQLAPWDEEANRQVMRLLVWTGQREAALRQFAVCEQVLAEQLTVEPSRETVDLLRQIQERKLQIPATPPAFLTERKARRDDSGSLFVARERELTWLNQALDSALAGQGGLVFLTGGPGRGKTVLMDAFARQALKTHPELLAASGSCDAGAADPYLPFRDMMAMLTGDVEAKWSAGAISRDHARRLWEAMPLVAQALLEHGPHLLPILLSGTALVSRAMAAEPARAPWLPLLQEQVQRFQGETADVDQSHLFEQFTNVLRAVAEKQPILLLLDDLQWMNAASTGLLFHLGRRLTNSGSRILIVCAYRPEEIIRDLRGGRQLLAKVLGEFRQTFGDVWLSLSWADETGGRRFVDAVVDGEPNRLGERFRASLFQRTGGHPLFTVELLRTMRNRGDLIKDSDGCWRAGPELDWAVLPARVEAVIEERIGRLETELRQILAVASVEGENFTAEVVARVQGLSQRQLLGHLSQELEKRHRLVREREQVKASQQLLSRYQFAHVLFQRYLYESLGAGQRRLLHGEIGQALEALFEGQTDEKASQLAYHFLKAGEREKAIEYALQAARRAKALYAHEEAIQHLQTALDLLETAEQAETRLELLEELADAHSVFTTDTQAISYYQAALEMWSSLTGADNMIAVRLHRKILEFAFQLYGNVVFEVTDPLSHTLASSRAYLEARLPLAQSEQPQLEWVRVLATLANESDTGDRAPSALDKAEGHAQAAVDLAGQLDAPVEMSDALEALARIYFVRGLLPEQLEVSRRQLALSQDPRFSDLRKRSYILENLSDALIAVGEYDQALSFLLELENLTSQIGAFVDHIWALGLQALCLFRFDRWEEIFRLDEKRRELEGRHSSVQLGGGYCVILSLSAAARALQGDLDQARVQREQAYEFMLGGAEGPPENWARTEYY
jgi:DNA-binding SARP family transcriptional activator/tetratricopeptide (TPR) repeat protein